MSSDPPPQPTLPTRLLSRRMLLGIVGSALAVLCIVGVIASVSFGAAGPTLSDVTTAHGLAQGMPVNETRVFDIGEQVHIVYSLSGGKIGATLVARVTLAGKLVDAAGLMRTLRAGEAGRESLVFVPKSEGVYQARLLLNNAAVPGAEVTFKVAVGGSHLQDVATARAIDQQTYRPLDQTDVFARRDTINLTYRVVNAEAGAKLAVVYYIDGKRQPEDARDHDSFEEAGTFRGFFSISGTHTALAVGNYRAELFYNGDLVAVRRFRVE